MKTLISISLYFLLISCSLDNSTICHLKGKVIYRSSMTLLLKKQTDDHRVTGIEIPIDSTGRFNYDLNYQFVEAYELIFKDELDRGAWRPILLFPDSDTIEFELYPMEQSDKNIISGSELSLEENKYNHITKNLFFEKYLKWNKILDSLMSIKEEDSEYFKSITDSINNLTIVVPQFEFKYLMQRANLYSYSRFIEIMRNEIDLPKFPIDTLKKYNEKFKLIFSGHPYNTISQYRLNGLINIRVGGNIADFSAPDSTGRNYNITKLISNNKFTIIDMWAPWCGPCINKSKKLLPVYEQYKDSGFSVIGVIGGISKREQFHQAIHQFKYPWLLLSEINNEKDIWEKYGISRSGGRQFFVDSKGKILAINPSPEEIEKIIKEK